MSGLFERPLAKVDHIAPNRVNRVLENLLSTDVGQNQALASRIHLKDLFHLREGGRSVIAVFEQKATAVGIYAAE
jgi:hypothetical protein